MFELTEEVKMFFVSYNFDAADFDVLLSVRLFGECKL